MSSHPYPSGYEHWSKWLREVFKMAASIGQNGYGKYSKWLRAVDKMANGCGKWSKWLMAAGSGQNRLYKMARTVLSRWLGKRHAQSHADCKACDFSRSRHVGHLYSSGHTHTSHIQTKMLLYTSAASALAFSVAVDLICTFMCFASARRVARDALLMQ